MPSAVEASPSRRGSLDSLRSLGMTQCYPRAIDPPMSPQRPLRIVHIVATPIGAPWMIALAREQKRLGHDVAAIIPSLDGTIAPALAADGIPCHAAALDV